MHLRCFSVPTLFTAAFAVSSLAASDIPSTPAPAAPVASLLTWVYYAPETPLSNIPVYTLPPSDDAVRPLQLEIDRLYTHAKTLPSGPDRRALQTRIYLFEKRIQPLAHSFNAAAWEQLRADVRGEWIAVQATLPAAKPAPAS